MNIYDGTGTRINLDNGTGAKRPWLNIAHAGEITDNKYGNSIYMYNLCKEYGVDGVECDLRMTSDGIIVLSHDAVVTGTVEGVETSLTIANSTYADLSALILFTIEGVDYHIVKFEELARMAFFWNWHLQCDFKSQANTVQCYAEAAKIARDYGIGGQVRLSYTNATFDDVYAYAPNAYYLYDGDLDSFEESVLYGKVPYDHVVISVNVSNVDANDRKETAKKFKLSVWNVAQANSQKAFELNPDFVQWTGGTDGVSISDTYLANVDWN